MAKFKTETELEIYHINDYETQLSYDAIFKRKIYANDSIIVNDGDVIFDIGANIGLFPLYLYTIKNIKNIRLFAFEPNPALFEILKLNIKLSKYNNAQLFQLGITDTDGIEEFIFYPNFSIGSSVLKYADWGDKIFGDYAVHLAAKRNNTVPDEKLIDKIKRLNSVFVKKEIQKCQVRNLSSFIKEKKISNVNLLKINAENSELDILSGLADEDWNKIQQLIVEVHDEDNIMLNNVISKLKDKGYSGIVKEDNLGFNSKTKIYLLYYTKKQ